MILNIPVYKDDEYLGSDFSEKVNIDETRKLSVVYGDLNIDGEQLLIDGEELLVDGAEYVMYDVDVSDNFTPSYERAIKSVQKMNGDYYFSDRGETFDKYNSKIVLTDITDHINDICKSLYECKGLIFIDTEGGNIFGPALVGGYSDDNVFLCQYQFQKYDIDNIQTSILELTLKPVQFDYKNISGEFSPDFIEYNVGRDLESQKNAWQSLERGSYGVSVRENGSSTNLKTQTTKFVMSLTNDEMSKLQVYVSEQRSTAFALNTNSHFQPFLNTNSQSVKILNFSFKPNGFNFWDVNLTLVAL
jgi:hypothetical protein